MANLFFAMGNFLVLSIITKLSIEEVKIDNLFFGAVVLITIGTLLTGSFLGASMIAHINASIMITEVIMLLLNRFYYGKKDNG